MWRETKIPDADRERLSGVGVLYGDFDVRPHSGEVRLDDAWQSLHRRWAGQAPGAIRAQPIVASYRRFYLAIGLSVRQAAPSVERMIVRFLRHERCGRFPSINPIVDAINLAAIETLIPLGAFDASRLSGEVELTFSAGGEAFRPLGGPPTTLPPGVLVLRDAERILSRFGDRDGDWQKVTAATRSVRLLGCAVPGVGRAEVIQALERAVERLEKSNDVRPSPAPQQVKP